MDIREYRYIIEVVDQGGITKAASAVYISQPSLSMYIKNLEKRLGFVFFFLKNLKKKICLHLKENCM